MRPSAAASECGAPAAPSQASGVRFTIAEMPEANELTIDLLAVLAQHERRLISERTKAVLAAAKRRGVRLGNPAYLDRKARRNGMPRVP